MPADRHRTHTRIGLDIGSTTVKMVALDERSETVYSCYRRHHSDMRNAVKEILGEARTALGSEDVTIRFTGSGGLSLAKMLEIGFVQEVIAVKTAVSTFTPTAEVVIELGGEDAKIVYLSGGLEERMNGSCAGGTGAFIDQMSTLMQTDAAGLDVLASGATTIYPIAARCGVFAKSDVQPLLNEGARREDVAASILQSVVTQTISGLACGRPIRGNVVFLGGPLNYLPQLRRRFSETLGLDEESSISPTDAHLFVAVGAALYSEEDEPISLETLIGRLDSLDHRTDAVETLAQLFDSEEDLARFKARHARAAVPRTDLAAYRGPAYLGIDAGSTTFKMVLVGSEGELLHSCYGSNRGDIVGSAKRAIGELYRMLPDGVDIVSSLATGYGEALLIAALGVDHGEIETVAHARAAREFVPDVDFILDIGGQDMKCLHIADGVIDKIMLNEACSSGCGSFIETFAESLGLPIEEFVSGALVSKRPVDLGSRCTVFMNSRVRQSQKEGATVDDIAAGLCFSVVKNALYKVIRINDFSELGERIVVQGGTFLNDAILRAFEQLTGREVLRPDIAGLMGAWGAALIARDRASENRESTLIAADELEHLSVEHRIDRCKKCSNACVLTISRFGGERTFTSGNRCERGAVEGAHDAAKEAVPNLFKYKNKRVFQYRPRAIEDAPRGEIGIPRALNIYENYPFWFTFFNELGFRVVISRPSTKQTYEAGIESMPSESVCYPAKLSHGHVEDLIARGVRRIFMPCLRWERSEDEEAKEHFNCPIVMSYPEVLKLNVDKLAEKDIEFLNPFLPYDDTDALVERLAEELAPLGVERSEVEAAVGAARAEDRKVREDVDAEAAKAFEWMERTGSRGIVLAGRPYHLDPEIHHGIPDMIAGFGLAVFTGDSISRMGRTERPLRVHDQWMYHTRLYSSATVIAGRDDLEMVQLNSFGCGLDALAVDQTNEILTSKGRLHTVLKIDEINNVGVARIRIRSLIAALEERDKNAELRKAREEKRAANTIAPSRPAFTQKMKDEGWTILCPQMAPMHFDLLVEVFRKHGYNFELLEVAGPGAVEEGLRHINNDSCFPALMAIGQLMEGLKSGRYDLERTAVILTQTGGICRATNYIALLRKALEDAGLGHVPVIALSPVETGESSPGFNISATALVEGLMSIVYGDTLARCLYRTRPYEVVPGSAEQLYEKWNERAKKTLRSKLNLIRYRRDLRQIVAEFDALPIEGARRARVGVVGEILVKYHPDANNHVVDVIEEEGCEATVGDMMGFIIYSCMGGIVYNRWLGTPLKDKLVAKWGTAAMELLRRPATTALVRSERFEPGAHIGRVMGLAEEVLSLCNIMGEGWLLTGEMRELIEAGVPNIVCVQPFACLPNHVVGKGVIKEMRKLHPTANIVAVDYDPGASETNQLNRIKLMTSTAKERHRA